MGLFSRTDENLTSWAKSLGWESLKEDEGSLDDKKEKLSSLLLPLGNRCKEIASLLKTHENIVLNWVAYWSPSEPLDMRETVERDLRWLEKASPALLKAQDQIKDIKIIFYTSAELQEKEIKRMISLIEKLSVISERYFADIKDFVEGKESLTQEGRVRVLAVLARYIWDWINEYSFITGQIEDAKNGEYGAKLTTLVEWEDKNE